MQSNGLISNFIDYTGNVTFKLKREGKIFSLDTHNAGTQLLMNTLAKFMAGRWGEVKDNIPKYIDFEYVSKDVSKDIIKTVLYQQVPFVGITSNSLEGTTGSIVTLNATIPSTIVQKLTDTPSGLRLCAKTATGDVLATIEDTDNILTNLYESLISSADAIIEWKLVFSNSSTGGAE